MACRSWSWAIFLCDKLKTVKDEQGLPHRLFPKTEAEERVGRHVEALRLCGEIPLKTRGKFVLTDKTSDGYEVAIEWELVNGSVPARPRRTWIGKVEYEETLIEFTVDGYPHRKTIYFLYGCGLWRKASMEPRSFKRGNCLDFTPFFAGSLRLLCERSGGKGDYSTPPKDSLVVTGLHTELTSCEG